MDQQISAYNLAIKTHRNVVTNSGSFGCPLPCGLTEYRAKINYFDKFDEFVTDTTLRLYVYYDTRTVEIQNEVLVYNMAQFLSAIGGTLGLYLGFSCLSLLLAAANYSSNGPKRNRSSSSQLEGKFRSLLIAKKRRRRRRIGGITATPPAKY